MIALYNGFLKFRLWSIKIIELLHVFKFSIKWIDLIILLGGFFNLFDIHHA